MVRKYKRTFGNFRNGKHFPAYGMVSQKVRQLAVNEIKTGTISVPKAADKYGVPKSSLYRCLSSQNDIAPSAGHPTLFSEEEEKSFVVHLIELSNWGYPFDALDLRHLARDYLNEKQIEVPFLRKSDNLPGRDWCLSFLKRWKSELSTRTASNISLKRSEVSRDIIDQFFVHATPVLENVKPELIINYDETNLTDDPGNKKAICKRGSKYVERIMHSSKSSTSVMYAGTASGHVFPPYVVYKSDHLWDTWKVGGPPGTRYNRTKSGWFDQTTFTDWFFSIIVPYCSKYEGKKVIIGDNLSSHFSCSVLAKCKELDISFVCLPPNATHIMQPLDIAFYGPLKKYWREVLTQWKTSKKGKILTKDQFPGRLKALHEKMGDARSANIIAGFKKSGIYPIQPTEPKGRLPEEDTTTPTKKVSGCVIGMLKEMRYSSSGDKSSSSRPGRRKKVQVPAGKSITEDDLMESEKMTEEEEILMLENEALATRKDGTGTVKQPKAKRNIKFDDGVVKEKVKKAKIDDGVVKEKVKKAKTKNVALSMAEIEVSEFYAVTFQTEEQNTRIYIGQAKEIVDSRIQFNFLRRKYPTDDVFAFPNVPDEDEVALRNIIKKMQLLNSHRGNYKFSDITPNYF